MKCSRRSSVHLTSWPSVIAAHGTRISSGHGCTIFTPNPPPTSGAITSTFGSGRPSLAAMAMRTLVEVWVLEWTRRDWSSASQRAYTPRPSSGMDALRSMSSRKDSVCGAASMASRAPSPAAEGTS